MTPLISHLLLQLQLVIIPFWWVIPISYDICGVEYNGLYHNKVVYACEDRYGKVLPMLISHEVGHYIQQQLTKEQWEEYKKEWSKSPSYRPYWKTSPEEWFADDVMYLNENILLYKAHKRLRIVRKIMNNL